MAVRSALSLEAESFLHTQRLHFIDLFYRSCFTLGFRTTFVPVYKKCLNSTLIVNRSINFVNLQVLT